MSGWQDRLHGDPLPWLLEPDQAQPAVRYFALRDLLGRSTYDSEVQEARTAIMSTGPVPAILAAQKADGYWEKPGPGYERYTGTTTQVNFLAQLGADGSDPQVQAACQYVLSHYIASNCGLSGTGAPSNFVHCHAGNLGAALIDLGWLGDPRLQRALEWHARAVTGHGVAGQEAKGTTEKYYKSGTTGPGFACAVNVGLPCGWGGIKALLAFSKVPATQRTPLIGQAIRQGVDFLFSRDPAVADYQFGTGSKPSGNWFKFGYPMSYVADVLQNLEVLATLGHAKDPRLAHALELVESKQDGQGRWQMEYTYNGKTWADIEMKGQPSKWITLRALRVLKASYAR
ncbi:MAG: nitrogen fixation protein NifH [Dehalococcoidia bacterium]|nr:nitrogen fixation protein NifH [Dehalococcoidia bacterium]